MRAAGLAGWLTDAPVMVSVGMPSIRPLHSCPRRRNLTKTYVPLSCPEAIRRSEKEEEEQSIPTSRPRRHGATPGPGDRFNVPPPSSKMRQDLLDSDSGSKE